MNVLPTVILCTLHGIKTKNRKHESKIFGILFFLVTVQMTSIAFIAFTTPAAEYKSLFLIPFEFISATLLFWAMYSLKMQSWNFLPGTRKNAVLAFRGPYKTIRHPMYLSILVFTLPLLFADYSLLRLGIMIILTVVLIMKIELEEKLLKKKFPGYFNYSLRTYRIIPYIY